jgi:hypothetical protein
MKGVKHWLPYQRATDGEGYYAELSDRLIDLDFSYENPVRDAWWRRIARATIGSRPTWQARRYKWWGCRYSRMLIKDPLAVFMSNYFYRVHGVNVLIMVRHPMAFYYSNKRLGWDFDFSNLVSQPHLIDDHLHGEKDLLLEKDLTYAERMGLLWRCIYKVVSKYNADNESSGGWVVCSHEDLCANPKFEFQRICGAFSLEFDTKITKFINSTTRDSNPTEAASSNAHVLSRNSQALSDYWRDKVGDTEISQVKAMVEDVAEIYYGEKSW